MERKYSVLLTVLTIATLLVSVFGAAFAYFVASNTVNTENQGRTDVETTQKMSGAIFESSIITFGEQGSKLGALDYPGGSMVIGTAYTITKKETTDQNNYKTKFTLGLSGLNTTTQTVNWYVLKVESAPLDSLETLDSIKCKLSEKAEDVQTMEYYYTECTAKDIVQKYFSNAKLVAHGTIANSTEISSQNIIKSEEPIDFEGALNGGATAGEGFAQSVSTKTLPTVSYYTIIEFPNNGVQDTAQNQRIELRNEIGEEIETELEN